MSEIIKELGFAQSKAASRSTVNITLIFNCCICFLITSVLINL